MNWQDQRDSLVQMLTARAAEEGAEPYTREDIEATADAIIAWLVALGG